MSDDGDEKMLLVVFVVHLPHSHTRNIIHSPPNLHPECDDILIVMIAALEKRSSSNLEVDHRRQVDR